MKAVAAVLFCVLLLAPLPADAELNGSIYVVQGGEVPILLMFAVSGETFVASILTYGGGGNGRWFAAAGTTDGTSGTGQVLFPQGFSIAAPQGATLQFQLSQPGGAAGTFATTGLNAFLSPTAGNIVRLFP